MLMDFLSHRRTTHGISGEQGDAQTVANRTCFILYTKVLVIFNAVKMKVCRAHCEKFILLVVNCKMLNAKNGIKIHHLSR